MRIKTLLVPYNKASKSAKEIAIALGIKRLKLVNSKANLTPEDILVNWGNSRLLEHPRVPDNIRIINKPEAVKVCANKLRFYEKYEDLVPAFTTSPEKAKLWIEEGFKVMARSLLSGNSGRGIKVCHEKSDIEEAVDAKVFTKYLNKSNEYRVHFFKYPDGSFDFHYAEKRLRRGTEKTEQLKEVRNYKNGWVFCFKDLEVPDAVKTEAMNFIHRTDLDFGAIDMIYKAEGEEGQDIARILEVNTAPGLQGTTLKWYTKNLASLLGQIKAESSSDPS